MLDLHSASCFHQPLLFHLFPPKHSLKLDNCEHGCNYTHPRLNKFYLRLWACKDGDIWYYSEQVIPLTLLEMSTECEVKRAYFLAEKHTQSSCFPSETS